MKNVYIYVIKIYANVLVNPHLSRISCMYVCVPGWVVRVVKFRLDDCASATERNS